MTTITLPSGHVVTERPAVVVAPPAARITTRYKFLNRFTMTELAAILTAAKTDAIVEAIMKKLEAVKDNEVDLDDPQTSGGVDTLIAKGLIDPSRRADILA
jgi:hypothetical protein